MSNGEDRGCGPDRHVVRVHIFGGRCGAASSSRIPFGSSNGPRHLSAVPVPDRPRPPAAEVARSNHQPSSPSVRRERFVRRRKASVSRRRDPGCAAGPWPSCL